jgi:DNA-directed RNA polymerase subunit beta
MYQMTTFARSNHDMIVYQKPVVSHGQKVKKGDVLCDCHAVENGELAVGANLTIAYMPWKGFNFEDAIIISSKVVEKDIFTSIHIKEHTLDVRETKL